VASKERHRVVAPGFGAPQLR